MDLRRQRFAVDLPRRRRRALWQDGFQAEPQRYLHADLSRRLPQEHRMAALCRGAERRRLPQLCICCAQDGYLLEFRMVPHRSCYEVRLPQPEQDTVVRLV